MTTGEVGIAFDDDVWELYDGTRDWTQARDLSKENPDKLHELQRLFIIETTRHNVLPLDDRAFERVLPEIAGRPTLVGDKQTLLPGMGALTEQHVVNWRNRSWSLTAQLDIPDGGASGVLLSLGVHQGGWSLYLKDGKPAFAYNLFGLDWTHVRADQRVPAGEHQVRVEFTYDGGGIGKGGDIALYQDGEHVASGRLERTEPIGFGYEYTDVGRDAQSPVTHDYTEGDNTFTGSIKWIEIEGGQDSHDHLVDPGQVFHYHQTHRRITDRPNARRARAHDVSQRSRRRRAPRRSGSTVATNVLAYVTPTARSAATRRCTDATARKASLR